MKSVGVCDDRTATCKWDYSAVSTFPTIDQPSLDEDLFCDRDWTRSLIQPSFYPSIRHEHIIIYVYCLHNNSNLKGHSSLNIDGKILVFSSFLHFFEPFSIWVSRFLVAWARLYSSLCLSVGRSVRNHFIFFMIFGHNCSCPITRDCAFVYTNLFLFDLIYCSNNMRYKHTNKCFWTSIVI